MRIIAGTLKGRRLLGPSDLSRRRQPAADLRPTSDRLRETLFNVLGPSIAGARVLDLFAGTGAVGLEAISRGAAHATFVERDAAALDLIRDNVRRCGAQAASTMLAGDAAAPAGAGAAGPYDVVFVDPPYGAIDLSVAIEAVAPLAAPGAICILEHSSRRDSPASAGGWRRTRVLEAGDSALSFYSL